MVDAVNEDNDRYVHTGPDFAAQPAQAVDLGQFREAVKHWRRDLVSDYAGGHINDGGTAMAEADRLLALIDSQAGVKP